MNSHLLQSMIFSVVVFGCMNAFFMKNVLKRHGRYAVSFAGGYFNDVKDILKLARVAPNRNEKVKYFLIGWLDILLTISFVVLAILFFKYFPF